MMNYTTLTRVLAILSLRARPARQLTVVSSRGVACGSFNMSLCFGETDMIATARQSMIDVDKSDSAQVRLNGGGYL
jgi:hypothetical protein